MSGLGERRRVEWNHQVESLSDELRLWASEAEKDGPLEKNHSQVRSIVIMLQSFAEEAGVRTREATCSIGDLQDIILDLHHVWDFFRSKLTLRFVEWSKDFLVAADEFAWACYRPAVEIGSVRGDPTIAIEPPLVFLNRSRTPFAQLRGSEFLQFGMSSEEGRTWQREIPFPMIGIPWYTTHYVPDLLYVAHEVGHHIEDRFDLDDALRQRIADAGVSAEWLDWSGEVFADVYGCIAAGEAYAVTLFDALMSTGAGVDTEKYPPAPLRARVCLAAVESIRGPAVAAEVASQWPEPWPEAAISCEAEKVVNALLADPYEALNGYTLDALLGLGSQDFENIYEAGTLLLRGITPSFLQDVRAMIAAAALAFHRDPDKFDEQGAGDKALCKVRSLVRHGVRAGANAAEQAQAQAVGRALFHAVAEQRSERG
ncbi:hypothetical protein [Frankia sp. Cas3]|uniref:hypothetical protein n=1 Tax=Frankia sp. Cas3 TaxID=3073926 RepID=UPI002AD25AE1|nr:hypothetical protein [Frankia sp. Cas3]